MREPENQLAVRLRALRTRRGLSGAAAAQAAGLNQSKVSRIEVGAYVPHGDEVAALCRAYGATAADQQELAVMAHQLREDRPASGIVLEREGWWLRDRIDRIEQRARRVCAYSSTTVHPLAQTHDYARALLTGCGEGGDPAALQAATDRQALLDGQRRFTFWFSAGALRWHVGSPEVMAEQLDWLVAVSRRPHVEVGVIPWTVPLGESALAAFAIYDAAVAVAAMPGVTAVVEELRDVDPFTEQWERLRPHVASGDDARDLVRQAAREYRSLTRSEQPRNEH